MDDVHVFIENLKFVMQDRNLSSQPKMAAASGVSATHIGNILRGDKVPSLAVMQQLSAAVGLKVWQMLLPTDQLKRGITAEFNDLLEYFLRADDQGRETILRVAASQALLRDKDA